MGSLTMTPDEFCRRKKIPLPLIPKTQFEHQCIVVGGRKFRLSTDYSLVENKRLIKADEAFKILTNDKSELAIKWLNMIKQKHQIQTRRIYM